jgi:hypothetical protein
MITTFLKQKISMENNKTSIGVTLRQIQVLKWVKQASYLVASATVNNCDQPKMI